MEWKEKVEALMGDADGDDRSEARVGEMSQGECSKQQRNISEIAKDHCRDVEAANKSRMGAIVASVGSAVFLIGAIILEVWESVRGSIIALIAAGVAAGIAVLNFWSIRRAAEQVNAAYRQQYQVYMFNETKCLSGASQLAAADANSTTLVSEWLALMKAIATQPVEGPGTRRR